MLLACLATQIAMGEPSLAEKSTAENAAIKKEWESWNAPFQPFRLIGNIHYVGASGISSFFIATPEGHILIDTGFETTVPRIRESASRMWCAARGANLLFVAVEWWFGGDAGQNFINALPVHAARPFRDAGVRGSGGDLRGERSGDNLIHADLLLISQFIGLSHERIRYIHLQSHLTLP